ncbi:hypothetical protein [Paraburkholderia humisilvae]|nr:hypothetical protein [Paraburkholderia humisilvae]
MAAQPVPEVTRVLLDHHHFAQLYRGTASFSYGRTCPCHGLPRASTTKKMMAKLARKYTKRDSPAAELFDTDNLWQFHQQNHSFCVEKRGNDSGGNSQQQGQQQDDHAPIETTNFRKTRKSGKKVRPPSFADGISSQSIETAAEGTRANVVSDNWCSAMLALIGRMLNGATPPTDVQAKLSDLMLGWHESELRYGPLPRPQLALLLDIPQATGDVSTKALPEQIRGTLLLVPLVLLQVGAPLTPRQRERAINFLSTMPHRSDGGTEESDTDLANT